MVPDVSTGLVVRGLCRSYGGHDVLRDLDLRVEPGEIVAVVGPNGSGKTTLLRCVVGSDRPDAGEILLGGRAVDERQAWTRRAVAAVLDDLDCFADLTLLEHLDLLARAHGTDAPYLAATSALGSVGLLEVADRLPGTLSSGQRRRLELATTLVRDKELLVLDEPEQRLDAEGRAWLGRHLRDTAASGTAVLLSSHDHELLRAVDAHTVDVVTD